jgi:hypothetical protein
LLFDCERTSAVPIPGATFNGQYPMNNYDMREQLVNERKSGAVTDVQLPLARITKLHGILFDLDPHLYQVGNTLFPPAADPKTFFEQIRPVLDRHPLARCAEVRVSGTGLHVIVWLDPPVQLDSAPLQEYWGAVVRAVQCTLPSDIHAPGITALTRTVGSVNSKNGRVVEVLRPGQPVAPPQVEEYLRRVDKTPFKEVASVLLGSERLQPCPVCQALGSSLAILDRTGQCYHTCEKVQLNQIFDLVYASSKADENEKATDATTNTMGPKKKSQGRKRGMKTNEKAGGTTTTTNCAKTTSRGRRRGGKQEQAK